MSSEASQTGVPAGVPSGPTGLLAFVEAMRIPHWIKNAFVLAPILFSNRFDEPIAWARELAAGAALCLLSSAIYLINDVHDRAEDRAHPIKRNRAIASGRLSPGAAVVGACVLAVAGLGAAGGISAWDAGRAAQTAAPFHGWGLTVWAAGYLVLNLLYSVWLRDLLIVDVLVIALGFVLRAMAGAAAIVVPISPWLVLCTFTLCLFIALAKRRREILDLPADQAARIRRTAHAYQPRDVEHMLTVSTAVAILTYSLYCLAPGTVRRIGSAHMVWTIPLVIYGLFRYDRITRQTGRGDPVRILLHDRVMWLVVLAYAVLSGLVLRFGSHPAVRSILDVDLLLK